MIDFAQKSDAGAVRELWDIAFGEDKDFNDYFFENIFDFSNTLILRENGRLLSMAQMIPCVIRGVGRATYIYGAATHPGHRKKGLMTELLKASFGIDIKNGVKASILIPAEKHLFQYYKKIGYRTAFYVSRHTHKMRSSGAFARRAEYEDIPLISSIYSGDTERDVDYWKIQMDMTRALGGEVFINESAYAFAYENVEEIMYKDEADKCALLDFICSYLKKDSVEYTEKGRDIPFGMLRAHTSVNADNLYMNMLYN